VCIQVGSQCVLCNVVHAVVQLCLSLVASQMVGDFQPSVGEKAYTFEDVQGVSMCDI